MLRQNVARGNEGKLMALLGLLAGGKGLYNRAHVPARKVTYKVRAPKPYNKTKTNRKTKTKNTNDGTIAPNRNYIHGRPNKISKKFQMKCREAVSNVNTQVLASSTAVTTAIGLCGYYVSPMLIDPIDCQTMNLHIAGGGQTRRYVIKDSNLSCQISNCSNNSSYLRVYECVARQDTPVNSGLGYLSPKDYLTVGWTDAGLTSMATNIAGTAFSSPAFVTHFKISKVSTIQFRPGEVRRIVLADKSSFLCNAERYEAGGSLTLMSFAKRTRFFVFQQWGDVINDSSVKTNVNIDATKFDYVFTKRYQFQWNNDYDNTLFTSSTLPTITTAEEINDLTGAVQNSAEA